MTATSYLTVDSPYDREGDCQSLSRRLVRVQRLTWMLMDLRYHCEDDEPIIIPHIVRQPNPTVHPSDDEAQRDQSKSP